MNCKTRHRISRGNVHIDLQGQANGQVIGLWRNCKCHVFLICPEGTADCLQEIKSIRGMFFRINGALCGVNWGMYSRKLVLS